MFTPHTLLAQSAPERHFRPLPHFVAQQPAVQLPLPQSTSVSNPFCWPSGQLGAWHIPPAHTLLWQSAPVRHLFKSPHRGHWGSGTFTPPQSWSVSLPFLTPSLQLGGWQVPYVVGQFAPLHTPLTQSPEEQQFLPSPQVAPQLPPQSLSVSSPSFTMLAQVFTETQIPPGQLPLAQSPAAEHFCPSAHFLPAATQVVPPQSWSVSLPFFTPSLQLGC